MENYVILRFYIFILFNIYRYLAIKYKQVSNTLLDDINLPT